MEVLALRARPVIPVTGTIRRKYVEVMLRSCLVSADTDPERRWIEIRAASSVFEAAQSE